MGEQIIEFLKEYGYFGMGATAFLSGTILPVASEVLLVFFLSAGLNAIWLTLSAALGNSLAGVVCFMSGYLAKKEQVQKFFRISDKKMKRADKRKVFIYMTLGKLVRYSIITISTIGLAAFFGF